MKFAYADPPYLGKGEYYRAFHDDAMLWNDPETHRRLIERLQDEFPDGWSLSLSEQSLRVILPMCPEGARVGAWLTKQPRYRGLKAEVGAFFEPVIWVGGRRDGQYRAADFCIAQNRPGLGRMFGSFDKKRMRNGDVFLGGKPPAFCDWIFALIGAERGDEFHDLFPGSGAVGAAWARFNGAQPDLPLTPLEKLIAE